MGNYYCCHMCGRNDRSVVTCRCRAKYCELCCILIYGMRWFHYVECCYKCDHKHDSYAAGKWFVTTIMDWQYVFRPVNSNFDISNMQFIECRKIVMDCPLLSIRVPLFQPIEIYIVYTSKCEIHYAIYIPAYSWLIFNHIWFCVSNILYEQLNAARCKLLRKGIAKIWQIVRLISYCLPIDIVWCIGRTMTQVSNIPGSRPALIIQH